MKKISTLALVLSLQCGVLSPAVGFELDEILGAPYASQLVSAPGAERIAWVSYERGVRNIWTASAPDFEPRAVTDYQVDDGQRISGLQLTSDGAILLYEKGNTEKANPTSDPQHPDVRIHMIDLESDPIRDQTRELVAGSGAQISPDDSGFVYTHEGSIYWSKFPDSAEETTDDDAKPAPLFKTRGSLQSYSWSPDGNKIAFASDRDDHSFIGIYDIEEETVRWLSPGVDFDSHPSWSPDGDEIAFFRTGGLKKDEMRSLIEDRKVSLWVGFVVDLTAEMIGAPDNYKCFFE
jgi:dipeptidyl aminopeptidase/acylaminoacyl peptidase